MELSGAIFGLRAILEADLNKTEAVELCSDSMYCLGMANGTYNPTTNFQEVAELRRLVAKIKGLKFRWIKGHIGDRWQEKADELAGLGKMQNKLDATSKIK